MRSPRHRSSHRNSESTGSKRESSPRGRKRNYDSASPSPPRPSKTDLKNIRITISDVSHRKSTKFSILNTKTVEPDYKGAEEKLPRTKDQKKIVIEIRRNIPSNKSSRSPVRRSIRDPKTVCLSRKKDEGQTQIFDRGDIKKFKIPEEKRLIEYSTNSKDSKSSKDTKSSKYVQNDKLHRGSEKSQSGSNKSHSGSKNGHSSADKNRSAPEKMHSERNSQSTPSVQERLGQGTDRPLDRDELESRRPQIQSWEVNPEMVPRNRYYFEHDNREDFRPYRGRGGGRFGFGQGRGGSFNRGSYGGGFKRQRRGTSPDCWQHDKFQEVQEDNDNDEKME